MTAPHSPTTQDDTTRKVELNLTQVAAAALAAVTAAVLGSGLGTAGTLIGAAGASVITTVGTAVYKASLERSRERVRFLSQRGRSLPTSRRGTGTQPSYPAAAHTPLSDEDRTDGTDRGPQPRDRSPWFVTLRWGAVIVGAVGAFVLAMMVITGFEWANGATVGGNGNGTTIGRVVTDQPPPREPATPAPTSPGPASETPTEPTRETVTNTSTPDSGEQRPTETADTPTPSEATPTRPLIPPVLPGVEG